MMCMISIFLFHDDLNFLFSEMSLNCIESKNKVDLFLCLLDLHHVDS